MDSAQFREAEQASRLKTTLNTVGTEHFDQVVAISQGMINYAIKKIHQQNEDMNDFYGESIYGSIAADLSPSQLVIPVGNAIALNNNMVIWRTNFKTGTLTVKLQDGDKEYTMDGWSIDVRVPLSFENFDDTAEDTTKQKEYKAKQRKWVKDNFEVAGDYRPERLYAKMASGRWADVTFAGASFLVDGKKELYEEWKRQGNNADVSDRLESLFKSISLRREEDGMTTIGTRFKLDAAKIVDRPASYPPVTVIHRTFPYKMGPESGQIGWDKGVQGIQDPGARNCLLYCENVDDREMVGKQLPQSGNFTTIGSPNYPGSRVEGSFVLSHQLFFERFLLPHLQSFVMEAQIYPSPASFWASGNMEYFSSSYSTGANPAKDPKRDPNNPIYKFSAVPASGNVDAHYEANVEINVETPLYLFEERGEYAKCWAEGSPHVTVKWQKGGNRITVCGETNYNRYVTSAMHQTVDPKSHELSQPISWKRDFYTVNWELHIDVTVKDGGLDMSITHDKDSFVKVVMTENHKDWLPTDPKSPEYIRLSIDGNMKTRLQHLGEVLKDGFAHHFKFIYPGNGQLSFKNNIFNGQGDLLVEILFKDTPGSDKIVVPPPKKSKEHPKNEPGKGEDNGGRPKPTAKLEWTAATPVKASDSPVEIKITGKNTTQSTIYFSKIQAKYTGLTLGSELFKSVTFVTATGKTDEVQISVETESASKMSTPGLKPRKITSKKSECTVTYEAATSPIAVQPGGSIHLIAKGATGKAGTEKEIPVTEYWSDQAGKALEGNNTISAGVKVKLS